MEEIGYKKEVCLYFQIPNCPKKEWDGKSSFDSGVAVVRRLSGVSDYLCCTFDPKKDKCVRITKDFGNEPFVQITGVYPIPPYMDDDIEKMCLDDLSKSAMEILLQEKKEIIDKDVIKQKEKTYEWGYEFIHNKQEAVAYLKAKNMKGRIPEKEEVIKAKLTVMAGMGNKNKH